MAKKALNVYLSYAVSVCTGGNEVLVCISGGKKGKFRKYHIGGNNAGMHMLDEVLKSNKYIVTSEISVLMPNISFQIKEK